MARDIQLKLLPSDFPPISGYQAAGKNIPAKEVGGDYYDFVRISEDRYGFCLGDVSGKGMPAALLMANLQATLRGQILTDATPGICIQRANRLMYLNTDPQKFATLFYGILDVKNHRIRFCNAGHDNPFLLGPDLQTQRLHVGGPVLGFLPECAYEEAEVNLNPGDILLIYSDGITEAFNTREEEFGEKRLEKLVRENREKTADQLINLIFESVREFASGMPQMDDMTLFIIKRNPA